jgi:COP9 signalosome complex subunit 1
VQAYISSYTSHTKIYRLLFIAERNQGKPLELEALKLAADEVKQVWSNAVLLILLRVVSKTYPSSYSMQQGCTESRRMDLCLVHSMQ